MLRLIKICIFIGCLAVSIRSARAFSLGGPLPSATGSEPWQTPEIGYQMPSDLLGPHNLGEEYRWNMPVVYYAFDQAFLDYFGSNGVVEVGKAFAILNSLTNVSSYSASLSEFPNSTRHVNYSARALSLYDIKSTVLELMVEQLGLAQPERYTWTLHDRLPGTTCPVTTVYTVVKRNFDAVTFEPSSYVNGTLYSYTILEFCSGTPWLAYTEPYPVDPLAKTYTSVASLSSGWGEYYTGLTRDDVAGLRYLLRTNNMNVEAAGPGATVFTRTTNSSQTILTTLDLTTFLNLLPVTDPATLLRLYPDLDITSVRTNLVLTNSTTTFLYFTNYPWLPAALGPVQVFGNQSSLVFGTNYSYTFGNVVTNHYYSNWPTVVRTNVLTYSPYSVPPNYILQTNVGKDSTRRGPGGDFYILPTNTVGYIFVPGLVITNKGSTNIIDTNFVSISPSAVRYRETVYYFTNYAYVVYPIQLLPSTNATDLFQGIERISFVRRDYDSLLGQSWETITNNYTLTSVSQSGLILHPVRRVITEPDILFTATDLVDVPGNNTIGASLAARSIDFEPHVLTGLAGPGNIRPQMLMTLSKAGPTYQNSYSFINELGKSAPLVLWGSFDGTTNQPIVYPSGASIVNLENQVLMQITAADIPDGVNNTIYNGGGFQFTGTGGSPPYTWEVVNNALPAGLTLSSDGVLSGTPQATPATYDFTVRMTDLGLRSVQSDFSITIYPQ